MMLEPVMKKMKLANVSSFLFFLFLSLIINPEPLTGKIVSLENYLELIKTQEMTKKREE